MSSPLPRLGTLKRIDARLVWKSEAEHFTPWVKENIEALSNAIQIELELPEFEVAAGELASDVVAHEIGTGRNVVIENQLGSTDPRSLGQVLTYAAGLDARVVVWLSPEFRPEHRQVIDWLNANTREGMAFFAVEVELLQIDDSPYAPHFKLVAQPNDWQRAVQAKADAQPANERDRVYQQFFSDLLARYKHAYPSQRTTNKIPLQSWFTVAGAGRSGFSYAVAFTREGQMRVELAIDTSDRIVNKAAFDQLMIHKAAIEAEMGVALSWERLDNAKMSRIGIYRPAQVGDPEPARTQHLDWGMSMLNKLRKLLSPRLQGLQLDPAALAAMIEDDSQTIAVAQPTG